MDNSKPHFLARRMQEFQKRESRPFTCQLCSAKPSFINQTRLLDHLKSSHSEIAASGENSQQWKDYFASATNAHNGGSLRQRPPMARQQEPTHSLGGATPSSSDSLRPNVGDSRSRSTTSRPLSTPGPQRPVDSKIEDIGKLNIREPDYSSNPLKRGVQLADVGNQRSRRTKPLSGRPFIPPESNFERSSKANTGHRLFDPNVDPTGNPRKGDGHSPSHRSPNTKNYAPPKEFHNLKQAQHSQQPMAIESSNNNTPVPSQESSSQMDSSSVDQVDSDHWTELEPELLLQPETRPISHEQLVTEVKGIYAGLVMVEAKCIDVDDKQTAAAQEKDPAKKTKLTPEQWSALIALHKTLLHEHHDFFLASQHPSASPALSKLAAKYSMPARMWRHGIHAFLEVLRHRLPHSLDHMLAFIYIAYSMMALLYETVPSFEDTWIECLGDLGRYRMAIEDDDVRDREVWSGVARFWYGKAADKSPKVGRLYHHLAILARPYTIQQLSLYARSLTCIIPFESAKGSIMTLFNPILQGKDSAYHKSSSMEAVFIKAHGLLFTGRLTEDFSVCVNQLLEGNMFDKFIGRAGTKFKEIGVFVALANAASLLEYGVSRPKIGSRSTIRLALDSERAERVAKKEQNTETGSESIGIQSPQPANFSLTVEEAQLSLSTIAHACAITFGTFKVALQRVHDKSVQPMIHTYLVLLLHFAKVEKAISHIENAIPWPAMVEFLNTHATSESMTAKVTSDGFPRPDEGTTGRPLPEDFVLRGQLWTDTYFPDTWFSDAAIDDEERILELPSMGAPRLERILWLGYRISCVERWISFDDVSKKFSVTQYAQDLPPAEALKQPSEPFMPTGDTDSIMSGMQENDDMSYHIPDSPPKRSASITSSQPEQEQFSPQKTVLTKPPVILKREVIDDVEMTDAQPLKQQSAGVSPTKRNILEEMAWAKGASQGGGPPPPKHEPEIYDYDTNLPYFRS